MVDASLRQRRSSQTKRVVRGTSGIRNPFIPAKAEEAAAASVEVVVEQDKLLRRLISREDEPVLFVGGD